MAPVQGMGQINHSTATNTLTTSCAGFPATFSTRLSFKASKRNDTDTNNGVSVRQQTIGMALVAMVYDLRILGVFSQSIVRINVVYFKHTLPLTT